MAGAPESLQNDPWLGVNPRDPEFRKDPYPHLKRLRELDPVNRTPVGVWRLTRYADVMRLLRDVPCGVRTAQGVLPGVDESGPGGQELFMLNQDAPNHTRFRKLVGRAFTPRRVERLVPRIQGIVDDLLDAVEPAGKMDLIHDYAMPMPVIVICEMLGVPVADRERFERWTAEATRGLAGRLVAPPEAIEGAAAAKTALFAYFEDLIEQRSASLQDDLISGLIRAEVEGDRLTRQELVSQVTGLLVAGYETSMGLIANGLQALIRHPDQLERLRANPDLMPGAVEECLRYDGPIVLTVRILHDDVRFGDKTIPKDAIVMAMLSAANRDPDEFEDPDRFDIERRHNPHLAFSSGPHGCPGAHLARIQGQLAMGSLIRRFDDLALVTDEIEAGPSVFRVPGKVPITFTARRTP